MIRIEEPVILIRISQAYRDNMDPTILYDYTRGQWRLYKKRAENAEYAFSVYKGEIVEIYKIESWYKAGETLKRDNKLIKRNVGERVSNRYEFKGTLAEEKIREKYIFKSVKEFFKQGNSNPIIYINC
jgi:hypothetical protein